MKHVGDESICCYLKRSSGDHTFFHDAEFIRWCLDQRCLSVHDSFQNGLIKCIEVAAEYSPQFITSHGLWREVTEKSPLSVVFSPEEFRTHATLELVLRALIDHTSVYEDEAVEIVESFDYTSLEILRVLDSELGERFVSTFPELYEHLPSDSRLRLNQNLINGFLRNLGDLQYIPDELRLSEATLDEVLSMEYYSEENISKVPLHLLLEPRSLARVCAARGRVYYTVAKFTGSILDHMTAEQKKFVLMNYENSRRILPEWKEGRIGALDQVVIDDELIKRVPDLLEDPCGGTFALTVKGYREVAALPGCAHLISSFPHHLQSACKAIALGADPTNALFFGETFSPDMPGLEDYVRTTVPLKESILAIIPWSPNSLMALLRNASLSPHTLDRIWGDVLRISTSNDTVFRSVFITLAVWVRCFRQNYTSGVRGEGFDVSIRLIHQMHWTDARALQALNDGFAFDMWNFVWAREPISSSTKVKIVIGAIRGMTSYKLLTTRVLTNMMEFVTPTQVSFALIDCFKSEVVSSAYPILKCFDRPLRQQFLTSLREVMGPSRKYWGVIRANLNKNAERVFNERRDPSKKLNQATLAHFSDMPARVFACIESFMVPLPNKALCALVGCLTVE